MSVRRRAALFGALVMLTCAGGVRDEVVSAGQPVETARSAAPCPDPTDPIEPADVDEAAQLLIGTWVLCSGQVLPPTTPAEVGIEFDADGRFFRVYDDGDGGLIRVEGLEQEGEWEFIGSEPGSTQLDLRLLGSGTFIQQIDFFATPPLVQASSMGGDASLVAWTGASPVPGVPVGVGEGLCGLPRDPVELTSVGQVEQLLAGTWLTCSEASPFGPPAFGEVGITMTSDGRFFRVYEDDDRGLIRAGGSRQEGTWVVVDTTTMNGPGTYQVDLQLLDVGTIIGHAVFLQQPSHLRLVTGGVPAIDLRPTTATPMPGAPPIPAPSAPPDGLPETGSNIPLALLASGLVAGGFVLLGISRRIPGRVG